MITLKLVREIVTGDATSSAVRENKIDIAIIKVLALFWHYKWCVLRKAEMGFDRLY